jgi:hypothetical protein
MKGIARPEKQGSTKEKPEAFEDISRIAVNLGLTFRIFSAFERKIRVVRLQRLIIEAMPTKKWGVCGGYRHFIE